MEWTDQVNFSTCHVAASLFAGPIGNCAFYKPSIDATLTHSHKAFELWSFPVCLIEEYVVWYTWSAIMRDESKRPKSDQTSSKPIIYIFTAAGKEISCIRVSFFSYSVILLKCSIWRQQCSFLVSPQRRHRIAMFVLAVSVDKWSYRWPWLVQLRDATVCTGWWFGHWIRHVWYLEQALQYGPGSWIPLHVFEVEDKVMMLNNQNIKLGWVHTWPTCTSVGSIKHSLCVMYRRLKMFEWKTASSSTVITARESLF